MNRHLVAGMLGLVLAGCTLDRSSGKRPNPNMPAVELTPPLPSIHEAINQENPDADRESLRAGHPPDVAESRRKRAEMAAAEPRAETDADPGRAELVDAGSRRVKVLPRDLDPSRADPAPAEEVASNAEPEGRAATFANRRRTARARPAPVAVPEAVEDESPVPPALETAQDEVADASLAPPVEASPENAEPTTPPDRAVAAPGELAATTPESATVVAPHAHDHATEPGPVEESAPPKAAEPGRDPLLGPNPEIMPGLDDLPARRGPGRKAVEPAMAETRERAPAIPSELPPTAEAPTAAAHPVELPPAPAEPPVTAAPEREAPSHTPPVVRLAPTEVLRTEPSPADDPFAPEPGAPASATPAPPDAAPRPSRDPLLGPNPQIMPGLDFAAVPPTRRAPHAAEAERVAPPSPSADPGGGNNAAEAPLPLEPAPAEVPAPVARREPAPRPVGPFPTGVPATSPAPASPVVEPVVAPRFQGPAPPLPMPTPMQDGEGLHQNPSPAGDAVEARPTPERGTSPARDPLLGPNPDIMPALDLPVPSPAAEPASTRREPVALPPAEIPIQPAPTQGSGVIPAPMPPEAAPAKAQAAPEPVKPVISAKGEAPKAVAKPASSKPAPPTPATPPAMPDDAVHAPLELPPLSGPESSNVRKPRPDPDARAPRERAVAALPVVAAPRSIDPVAAPKRRPAFLTASAGTARGPRVRVSSLSVETVDGSPVVTRVPVRRASGGGTAADPMVRAISYEPPPIVLPPPDGAGGANPPLPTGSSIPLTRAPASGELEPMSVRTKSPERAVFELGKPVAHVGDEVITLHELKRAIAVQRKGMPDSPMSAADRYMLAKMVLKELVDRAIVIQEAKRTIKNPKQLELFTKQADKIWAEEELPPLLKQTASANVYELKQKLAERDESLEDLRDAFRKEFLFRGFLDHKIGPRLKVELPEMRAYYAAHLNDFARPAEVTWREALVEVEKHPTRASARAKADVLLARLRRGEDFAAVAKSGSDGPNKSQGGLWQTSPGSYAVPAVNAALDTLPVGQVSTVIEGPTSYHLVRVEARRAAGPASFFEVQHKVQQALRSKKVAKESNAFLERLRRETVVTTEFDDPGVTRTSVELPKPAAAPLRR